MDEPKTRPGFPGDRSQAAAEKLRALRERADQALEEHRSRLGEIETQLSDRVRQLAEEYGASAGAAKSAGADRDAAERDAQRDDELESLRQQVAEGNAKHDKFVEQLIAAREQLDAIQSQPCASCQQAALQLATADEELRALREQLESSLREHDEDRLRHEKFVEQLTAARQAINVLQHAAGASTAELRGELEAVRAAKDASEEQLAAALRDMEALHGECDAALARAAAFDQELAEARLELAHAHEQAASLALDRGAVAGETEQLREEIAAVAAQLAQAEQDGDELGRLNLAAGREKEDLAASLATAQEALVSLQASTASLQASTQAEHAELLERLAVADEEAQAAARRLTASESEKLNLRLSLSQAESVTQDFQTHLIAAEKELDSLRTQAAMSAEVPELRAQLEKAQAAAAERSQAIGDLKRTLEEARGELAQLRDSMVSKADLETARRDCQEAQTAIAELQAAVAASHAEFAQAQTELAQAQTELAKGQAELAQAEAAAAAIRAATRPVEEFTELHQKFDLALMDVRKLKRENSGLRDELAGRPEASDQESPELIATRSERDALAARIADLETAAAAAASMATIDADAQQEHDDLQRRFEMAVDDVRQLKQENAQLRDKIAAGGKGGADVPAAAPAGGDWAAQRARLMAMLEEEDTSGKISPDRTAERATVSKTIAATDRVIANKDQEIAELRAALETHGTGTVADTQAAALRDEVLDADELIIAERQRLAQLSAEWESKLRAAELEFSVERAKLARDQAALRERIFDLDSGPQPAVSDAVIDTSKPRRRWLSALGIMEDDPKKK